MSSAALSSKGQALAASPVVETAVLHCPSLQSTETLAFLQETADACAHAAGLSRPFRLWHSTEDPELVYLIGCWPSLAAHYEWIASDANQKLLKKSEGLVTIRDFFHWSLPELLPAWVDECPVIAFTMQYPQSAKTYEEWYAKESQHLVESSGGKTASGWVVEFRDPLSSYTGSSSSDTAGGDEWVEISGWDSVQEHDTFRETEEYRERHDPTTWGDLVRLTCVHLRSLSTK